MTRKDLNIQYKQETGTDPIEDIALEYNHTLDRVDAAEIQAYIDWLQEKLINLYNL